MNMLVNFAVGMTTSPPPHTHIHINILPVLQIGVTSAFVQDRGGTPSQTDVKNFG